ncbi:g1234 [Coccomyxa elongata]
MSVHAGSLSGRRLLAPAQFEASQASAPAPDTSNDTTSRLVPPPAPAPAMSLTGTLVFNTAVMTGVGIAAVLICTLGCLSALRNRSPPPASASGRQRGNAGDEGTGDEEWEEPGVPKRRTVLVSNPNDDVIIGVELTPSAGHPVDVPMPPVGQAHGLT